MARPLDLGIARQDSTLADAAADIRRTCCSQGSRRSPAQRRQFRGLRRPPAILERKLFVAADAHNVSVARSGRSARVSRQRRAAAARRRPQRGRSCARRDCRRETYRARRSFGTRSRARRGVTMRAVLLVRRSIRAGLRISRTTRLPPPLSSQRWYRCVGEGRIAGHRVGEADGAGTSGRPRS
jgi:hypothetical protein